jgi:hypothetical protein
MENRSPVALLMKLAPWIDTYSTAEASVEKSVAAVRAAPTKESFQER